MPVIGPGSAPRCLNLFLKLEKELMNQQANKQLQELKPKALVTRILIARVKQA